MNIGRLNKKIDIRKQITTQSSASGEPVITWSTFIKQRWARVRPLGMRELFNAQQVQAMADTEFTIRYTTGIQPSMVVIYDGETYNIEQIIDVDGRGEQIKLLCFAQVT